MRARGPRCQRREAAHLASVVTRPSLPVLVQLLRWQFMLSSASSSLPRYVSPFLSSMVTVCPSASCSTLMGMPMCLLMLLARGDLRAGICTTGSGGALPPSADSQTAADHPANATLPTTPFLSGLAGRQKCAGRNRPGRRHSWSYATAAGHPRSAADLEQRGRERAERAATAARARRGR